MDVKKERLGKGVRKKVAKKERKYRKRSEGKGKPIRPEYRGYNTKPREDLKREGA